MDARRFPIEPWMASRKIPKALPVAGLFCRGGHFFLVTFSLGQQRKRHSAAAADEDRRVTQRQATSMDPRFRGDDAAADQNPMLAEASKTLAI